MGVEYVPTFAHLKAELLRSAGTGFCAHAPRFFTPSVPWENRGSEDKLFHFFESWTVPPAQHLEDVKGKEHLRHNRDTRFTPS